MNNLASCSCRQCGASTKITVYPSINVFENPELKEKVMDGSAFVWTCPQCGCPNLIKYSTLYHDPQAKLMIWLSDGDKTQEEALQNTFRQTEELKAYTARFVDDIGSLMEKVKIFDAGLDDCIIEMCKMVTCMEMKKEIPFKFFRLDGADGDITLTYPKDGAMEMVNIGFNVYEDCRMILKRNPQIINESTGFVRIDNRWISSFFR